MKKLTVIIVLLVSVACIVSASILLKSFMTQTEATREYSRMMGNSRCIEDAIEMYYRSNDNYPEILSELDVTYIEGADDTILEKFDYKVDSDKKECVLEFSTTFSHKVDKHIVIFSDGKMEHFTERQ